MDAIPSRRDSLPSIFTLSFELADSVKAKYEIAYYNENNYNRRKGRNFQDEYNVDNQAGFNNDPYGDSVGTQFAEVFTGINNRSKPINLNVVIFRRRCYLTTELRMADISFLPYPNVLIYNFIGTRPGSIANTNLGGNNNNPIVLTVLDTDLQSTYF